MTVYSFQDDDDLLMDLMERFRPFPIPPHLFYNMHEDLLCRAATLNTSQLFCWLFSSE